MFDVNGSSITNAEDIDVVLGLTPASRGVLIFVTVLIIVLGLLGNGIVLYSSIIHNSLKMDKISLMFVQNLAFSDLIIVIIYFIPMLITLSARRWVLGEGLCLLSGFFFRFILHISETFITVVISCYRVWILKKPAAVRQNIPLYYVWIVMVVVLCIPLFWVLGYILAGSYVYYLPTDLNCMMTHSNKDNFLFSLKISSIVLIVFPLIVLIVTNVAILWIVAKSTATMGRKAIPNMNTVISIGCICWAFILSYIPTVILYNMSDPPEFMHLLKVYILSINTIANPIIYSISNASFRNYLKSICCLGTTHIADSKGTVTESTGI